MSERAQALTLSPEEERNVINFDPWGEREASYRVLREGFARCRRDHKCAICCGPISVGDRAWFRTETDDGEIATFRFCPQCCWCIAHRRDEVEDADGHVDNSAWARMEERWELGAARAGRNAEGMSR